jgi:uncharacterized SAM-binding protein YcdF (DUF218 family)
MTSPSDPKITQHTRDLAKRLWDYHRLSSPLVKSDFILALGSHDERVAHHAAQLMRDGWAPFVVASGGYGKITSRVSKTTEAERFAQIMREAGVRADAIVVEPLASNTGENLSFTRALLATLGLSIARGILVTKPYMERRSYATAARQWPEVSWTVSSPAIPFETYPSEDVTERRMIDLMVGDLQRIAEYPRLGFQIPQEIPSDVWAAGLELAEHGFDAFALKRDP